MIGEDKLTYSRAPFTSATGSYVANGARVTPFAESGSAPAAASKNVNFSKMAKGGMELAEMETGGLLTSPLSFLGASVVGGVTGLIGSAITARAQNRSVDLQRDLADREWGAAKSVGLASPSQFTNGSSDYYQMNGRSMSVSKRSPGGNTPYSI